MIGAASSIVFIVANLASRLPEYTIEGPFVTHSSYISISALGNSFEVS